jgi:hypothetical protein
VSLPVLLFTHDPEYAAAASDAGIAGIVVDWEGGTKWDRQAGAGTEINDGSYEDLAVIRSAVATHVVCRINNEPATRRRDAALAMSLGADEIWLPMVRSLDDILDCLDGLGPGAQVGVLVETTEAMTLGSALNCLPITRVYVGLNDFRIDRGHADLFEPLYDGTVERFRADFGGQFGVAGVTDPDRGSPVPQRRLLQLMAGLSCDFGVARRSFRADVPVDAIASTLARLDREYDELRAQAAAPVDS